VQAVYDYDIDPEDLEDFNAEVRAILNEELGTEGNTPAEDWWYKPEVELPTRQGTLEETSRINQLIIAAGIAGYLVKGVIPQPVSIESIFTSRRYLKELRNVYAENFQVIKTLSDRTAGQVINRINSGIKAGSTPTKIAEDIAKRFDVSKSSAKRIADTEINWAYNSARSRAVDYAAEETGMKAAVMHISALTPTTRATHAARHGKVYTVAEQNSWWDTADNGTARINCKCTTRSVLLDKNNNVISTE
jgi:SPP1 gp7 family putative phage head morphogenesis protein